MPYYLQAHFYGGFIMKKVLKEAGENIFGFIALFVHIAVSATVFLFLFAGDVWLKLRRELIILVFGYGGDIFDAVNAGIRGLFDPDYARKILNR